MLFLSFVGVISFIFGLLLLFSPQALRNLNGKVNALMGKLLCSIDESVYKFRIGIGISSILVSSLAFFIVYFLVKKYG